MASLTLNVSQTGIIQNLNTALDIAFGQGVLDNNGNSLVIAVPQYQDNANYTPQIKQYAKCGYESLVACLMTSPSLSFIDVGAGGSAPGFQNSWGNYNTSAYNGAGFCIDPWGFVHLRGVVVGGINGSIIFTLPSGYVPLKAAIIPVAVTLTGTLALPNIIVLSTGDVIANFGPGTLMAFSLDGVTFSVN